MAAHAGPGCAPSSPPARSGARVTVAAARNVACRAVLGELLERGHGEVVVAGAHLLAAAIAERDAAPKPVDDEKRALDYPAGEEREHEAKV